MHFLLNVHVQILSYLKEDIENQLWTLVVRKYQTQQDEVYSGMKN